MPVKKEASGLSHDDNDDAYLGSLGRCGNGRLLIPSAAAAAVEPSEPYPQRDAERAARLYIFHFKIHAGINWVGGDGWMNGGWRG